MKVIVVGAGVLGASAAYQLAKRGCEVELFDRGAPGAEASAASLAWLNSCGKELRPYHDLNVISMAEHHAVARELGTASWLHGSGNIEVAADDATVRTLRAKVDRLHGYGYAAIELDPKDLPRYDPVIRVHEDYRLAVYYPGESWADLPLLVHELLRAATASGTVVRPHTPVARLLVEPGAVAGVVLADGTRVRADTVLVAAGSRIGELMSEVGVTVSTSGAPGVTVVTSPGTSALSVLLHLPGLTVRPDTGGRVAVRSSRVDGAVDMDRWVLPDEAVAELFHRAAHGVTDVDPTSTSAERIRIAVRPYPFDGLPVVGHWNGVPNLYLMTMHSGATLSAVMGRLAAEEIVTGTPSSLLTGFRPERVIAAGEESARVFDPHTVESEV
jgi:glycine/D-amino acid oxidase-like deaminating enzyme